MAIGSIIPTTGVKSAYGAGRSLQGGAIDVGQVNRLGQETFIDFVEQASKKAAETVKNADFVAQQGIAGKVDVQQVVQATMAAEATIQTVVAMRDRFISAYQEVLRMPI